MGARALGYGVRILGISVDPPADELLRQLAGLATATASQLRRALTCVPEDFAVNDDYLGDGYGVVRNLEPDAMRILTRSEGVLLDPVYTGRAFGGLLDLIRQGAFQPDERVLFWHTGGTAGLFGYGDEVI